jgi:hypothetical protein
MSCFCLQSLLANVSVLLVDSFAALGAMFADSPSSSADYLRRAINSPLIGRIIDRFAFMPVWVAVSVLPLLGLCGLHLTLVGAGPIYDPVAVAAA